MATLPKGGGVAMFERNNRPRKRRRKMIIYSVCCVILLVTGVVYSFNYYTDQHGKSLKPSIDNTNSNNNTPNDLPIDNPDQKITNSTLIVFTSHYSMDGCGHDIVEEKRVSQELDFLINKDKKYLKQHYSAWQVKSFSEKKVNLFRTINNKYCPNHYKIAIDKEGYIVVYGISKSTGQWTTEPIIKTEGHISLQPMEDQQMLREGKIIHTNNIDDVKQELANFDL
jgi:hypothetical protein